MKRKNKISGLKDIVSEIELFGEKYRSSDNEEAKKAYNQYVELIILDAPNAQQYNLCDYWARLIR